MIDKTFRIGAVGHRDLDNIEKQLYAYFCCHRLLAGLLEKYATVMGISAMSEGADSIFAQSAVSLGVPLESIIPSRRFDSEFHEDFVKERYQSLLSQAKYITRANFPERSHSAYRKSMEWVVFKSNAVVAIWDGRKKGTIGGTWEAVSLSFRIRKPVVHIDYDNKALNLYFNNGDNYRLHQDLSVEQIIRRL